MKQFITTYEHYCPVIQKNIIIKETSGNENSKINTCLNSYECGCEGGCRNTLFCSEIVPANLNKQIS